MIKLTLEQIIYLLSGLFMLAGLGLLYALWVHPMLQVTAGYSAQTACQQHFIAGRKLDFTYSRELSAWSAAPVEVKGKKVTAYVPFLPYSQTSTFIPAVGCVLGWRDPATIKKPKPSDDDYYDESREKKLKNYPFKTTYKPIRAQKLPRRINAAAQKIAEAYVARQHLYTRGFVIARNGTIIAEAYGDGATAATPHQGWSMTKSLIHALYGVAIKERLIDIDKTPVLQLWSGSGDSRRKITLDELFRMHSGLAFDETYVPPSDATEMLFTKVSQGRFAALKFLESSLNKRWHYSSGTTNILSWHLTETLQKKNIDAISYMREKLFAPLGMSSMVVSPDFVGTPSGSSFGFATAEDWLKLGLLYQQKGKWRGRQIVPADWVAKARTPTDGSKGRYGHHWWLNDPDKKFERDYPAAPHDAFWAGGFNGQTVMVIPSRGLVIARLGWTVGEKTELNDVIEQLNKVLP